MNRPTGRIFDRAASSTFLSRYGALWRMYYIERDDVLIIMLGGGSKATQRADIARAIAITNTIED